jgi:hypothetical protein
MRHKIVQTQVVIKSVWPKCCSEVGAGEHGTQSVFNSLMRAVARAFLMGGIRTCQLSLTTEIGKGVKDFATTAKFTTTIHADIFVRTRRGIVRQPLIEPINRRGFGSKGTTDETATEMINDEDIASFPVMSHQIVKPFGIRAALYHEDEVDAETLEAGGSSHGVGVTTRGLTKFGCHAYSTLIDNIGERERRDAASVLVEFGKSAEVEVSETLMP